jgi:arylsulfatase
MDPYERGADEGGQFVKFEGQQMWLLVRLQQKVKEFFADYDKFPHQEGNTLNPSGIGYSLLPSSPTSFAPARAS